jgi:Hint module
MSNDNGGGSGNTILVLVVLCLCFYSFCVSLSSCIASAYASSFPPSSGAPSKGSKKNRGGTLPPTLAPTLIPAIDGVPSSWCFIAHHDSTILATNKINLLATPFLTVDGRSTSGQEQIPIQWCANGLPPDGSLWQFTPASQGAYTIQNKQTTLYLSVFTKNPGWQSGGAFTSLANYYGVNAGDKAIGPYVSGPADDSTKAMWIVSSRGNGRFSLENVFYKNQGQAYRFLAGRTLAVDNDNGIPNLGDKGAVSITRSTELFFWTSDDAGSWIFVDAALSPDRLGSTTQCIDPPMTSDQIHTAKDKDYDVLRASFSNVASFSAMENGMHWQQQQCFPSDARVLTLDGRCTMMADLRLGDKVLCDVVDTDRTDPTKYDEIYMFGHRDAEATDEPFLRLRYSEEGSIRLTPDHRIPIRRFEEGLKTVPARDVRVGDELFVVDGGIAVVQAIEEICADGLWNPYTLRGTIVVDGVLASCHSSSVLDGIFETVKVPSDAAYQVAFAPIRWTYGLLGAERMRRWGIEGVLDRIAGICNGKTKKKPWREI